MIEHQLDHIVEDMRYRLSYMYRGMKLEDYLKYTGGTIEELREARKADAERDVKTRLTLEAIVKAENLDVTDAEVEAEIVRMAEAQGKSADDLKSTSTLARPSISETNSFPRNSLLSLKRRTSSLRKRLP